MITSSNETRWSVQRTLLGNERSKICMHNCGKLLVCKSWKQPVHLHGWETCESLGGFEVHRSLKWTDIKEREHGTKRMKVRFKRLDATRDFSTLTWWCREQVRRRPPPLAHSRSLRASGASHTTGRLPHRSPRLYKHRKMINVLFKLYDDCIQFCDRWKNLFPTGEMNSIHLSFLLWILFRIWLNRAISSVKELVISQWERSSQLQESWPSSLISFCMCGTPIWPKNHFGGIKSKRLLSFSLAERFLFVENIYLRSLLNTLGTSWGCPQNL